MNEKKMTVNPMWVLFLGACPRWARPERSGVPLPWALRFSP